MKAKAGARYMQKANLRLLKRNENHGLNFQIPKLQRNNPFTIIPEIVYDDFKRNDFKRHTIQFPLHIPVRYQRMRMPRRPIVPENIPLPRLPNYGHLTGNQLLLVFARIDELSPYEISEVFFNLAQRPQAAELNLEKNGLVVPALKRFLREVDTWTVEVVTRCALVFFQLKFEDNKIWEKIRFLLINKIYAFERLNSRLFGHAFTILWEKFGDELDSNNKELLIDQLPRYLKKMRPDVVVAMFELAIKYKMITSAKDYLFERHFLMMFWRTPYAFNTSGHAAILRGVQKIDLLETDPDFLHVDFLPTVGKKLSQCEDNVALNALLVELQSLIDRGTDSDLIKHYISLAEQRLLFVESKLKLIKETEFVSIVKADLQRYRQLRMQKKQLGLIDNASKDISDNGNAAPLVNEG